MKTNQIDCNQTSGERQEIRFIPAGNYINEDYILDLATFYLGYIQDFSGSQSIKCRKGTIISYDDIALMKLPAIGFLYSFLIDIGVDQEKADQVFRCFGQAVKASQDEIMILFNAIDDGKEAKRSDDPNFVPDGL